VKGGSLDDDDGMRLLHEEVLAGAGIGASV